MQEPGHTLTNILGVDDILVTDKTILWFTQDWEVKRIDDYTLNVRLTN